jgi:hypothetical protein
MGPRNAYKDRLDNVVSPITCVSMNDQNQLEQMENGAMFATNGRLLRTSLRFGEPHKQALCGPHSTQEKSIIPPRWCRVFLHTPRRLGIRVPH